MELGTKATTATLATLDAFHAYGVRRYGLVVPYTLEVTERMIETYRAEGFECLAEEHLGLSRNVEFAEVPPSQIAEMVRAVAPAADAVAIVCTNLRAAPLVAELERSLGIPVVDSLAATVWRSLDLASPGNSVFGWGGLAVSGALRSRFQPILEKLLEASGAGRTTIRLDLTRHGLSVDRVAGEAHRQGIRSIRQDGSLDQWAMPTVQWLNNHHDILAQTDVETDAPPVTPALIEVYGVRAQMLGPLLVKGQMLGWISVHEVGAPRKWTGREISALDQACRAAVAVIGPVSPTRKDSGEDRHSGLRQRPHSASPSQGEHATPIGDRTARGEGNQHTQQAVADQPAPNPILSVGFRGSARFEDPNIITREEMATAAVDGSGDTVPAHDWGLTPFMT